MTFSEFVECGFLFFSAPDPEIDEVKMRIQICKNELKGMEDTCVSDSHLERCKELIKQL